MTIKQTRPRIQLISALATLMLALSLPATADQAKLPPITREIQTSHHKDDQPVTEKNLDLVSILVKFADLNTAELPAEKFERYFKTKVVWTVNQATGLPGSFEGSAPAYGITATGSHDINKVIFAQGIWMIVPRSGRCVLLRDLLPYVPQLKKSTHLRSPVFREDDPTQWEFYETYSKEEKLNRVSFYFAFGINSDRLQPENKRCLREMTSTQYLP